MNARTCLILLALLFAGLCQAAPTGTAFTYQGELQQLGAPADGPFDFQFQLFADAMTGIALTAPVLRSDVVVIDGVFTVELDFGSAPFDGQQLWLEVAVREGASSGGYTGLLPRQKITAAPYALHALNDADTDPGNELQDLTLADNTLSLSGDASPVDLSGYLDDTDDQNLTEVLKSGNDAGTLSLVNVGSLGVGGTTTTGALNVSGLDCTFNANGGALTVNASGVVSCSDDDASAGNTLDAAYDQGGAGAGRTITADSGAVIIEGSGGLVLDAGNLLQVPGDPVLVGSLAVGPAPVSVYVSGRYAYVVDQGSDDLKVIDVSDPAAPSLAGSLAIGTFPYSVYVSGRYAYVVDSNSRDLKVIDVSDPALPSLVGSVAMGSSARSVYVSGRYAYVVDEGSDDLNVIDVSDPAAPSLAGSLAIGTQAVSVYVLGRYAYVVDQDSDDLKVIDVSDPALPSLAGSLAIGTLPVSVYVSGRYAYVVDSGSDDLKVIDVSDPALPSLAGSLAIGTWPRSVYVSGRYAYVVDRDSEDLKVIDVSDPAEPTLAASLPIGAIAWSVYVSGRYAYVLDPGSDVLKVIDISGAEVNALMAHSLEAGNLQVRNDIVAQGQLQVTSGINVGTGGLFSDGDVGVAGDVSITGDLLIGGSCTGCASDASLKRNVRPLGDALDRLARLRGVRFDWREDAHEARYEPGPQIGVLGEDVAAVFPELVGTDSRGYQFVRYQRLVAPLIEAVKELKEESDRLRAENEALIERVAALEEGLH